jgi:hypothetical protein
MSKVLTKSFGIGLTRRSAAVPIRNKQWDNLKNCPTAGSGLNGPLPGIWRRDHRFLSGVMESDGGRDSFPLLMRAAIARANTSGSIGFDT